MNWENKVTSIEQENDWKAAILLLDSIEKSNPSIYLRVMFLLLALVVEGKYTQEEHDYAADKLKYFFNSSIEKFSSNAEFLFFAGFMACGGEWYFGMNSIEPAIAMLEKAMRLESNNSL